MACGVTSCPTSGQGGEQWTLREDDRSQKQKDAGRDREGLLSQGGSLPLLKVPPVRAQTWQVLTNCIKDGCSLETQARVRSSEDMTEHMCGAGQARGQPQDPKDSSKKDTPWLSCLSAGQGPAQVPPKQHQTPSVLHRRVQFWG